MSDRSRPRRAAPAPELAADDLWRFGEGTHDGLAYLLGAQPDAGGTTFRVWAPSARSVTVVGDFDDADDWSGGGVALAASQAGIWSGRVDDARQGHRYKYRIVTATGAVLDKSDPLAFACEEPPRTASVIADLDYEWGDGDWMASRAERNRHDAPISIYEVHLGSWRYEPGGYRAIAVQLADHLDRTGFTHVELMPVMEHPFYGSWGYQTTGYFAATARYGSPQDLMFLIDHLHQNGHGVILDWVPSHFPNDAHGLAQFDGTHLYEHADPRLGFHPDWKSAIFNYDRHEVRSFLLSSARFWIERYHADGLRVDAVASMLYRDYSRAAGEWIPNEHGGRENLGAVAFLQEFNRRVYLHHPDAITVAEESTAWPGVTRATDGGGLGFGFKWDMGWMNDTLEFVSRDAVHRRWHHGELTFRSMYAFTENFVLPLSHDEVVHGKGSLLARQPGDRWQQFAGLRLLFGYQYGQPGKKLLFMGAEIGMPEEWSHERELPWGLLQQAEHAGILDWVTALNHLHRDEPALHRGDHSADGFRWVVGNDDTNSVLAFLRLDHEHRPVLVVCNFTAVPRHDYRIGVPVAGQWTTLLNSDDIQYGGSGAGTERTPADGGPAHGYATSLTLTLPPMAACFLAPAPE